MQKMSCHKIVSYWTLFLHEWICDRFEIWYCQVVVLIWNPKINSFSKYLKLILKYCSQFIIRTLKSKARVYMHRKNTKISTKWMFAVKVSLLLALFYCHFVKKGLSFHRIYNNRDLTMTIVKKVTFITPFKRKVCWKVFDPFVDQLILKAIFSQ